MKDTPRPTAGRIYIQTFLDAMRSGKTYTETRRIAHEAVQDVLSTRKVVSHG